MACEHRYVRAIYATFPGNTLTGWQCADCCAPVKPPAPPALTLQTLNAARRALAPRPAAPQWTDLDLQALKHWRISPE